MNQRPMHLALHNLQLYSTLSIMALSALGLTFGVGSPLVHAVILTVLSLYWGYVFTIRVGGADMPITISLLNSFSGVAGAIAGFALPNGALLIVVGSIVGSSGLILTQIMCRAMNTSLLHILLGKTTVTPKVGLNHEGETKTSPAEAEVAQDKAEAVPAWGDALRSAQRVVIIPGYGMALAQAQLQVRQLGDLLQSQGKEIRYGIHPVAGRMPGHMNVLLAEVDVPYDLLYELDDINAFLEDTDVAIIVGQTMWSIRSHGTGGHSDLWNAHHSCRLRQEDPGLQLDTKPGYAGVDNSLYEMDRVELLWATLRKASEVLQALKGEKDSKPSGAHAQDDMRAKVNSAKSCDHSWLWNG